MAEIVPTILAEGKDTYKASIEQTSSFTKRIHIDITDGQFAPSITVEVGDLWWPQGCIVDIHAMVSYPSQYVDALIELHPNMVIFHAEALEDITPSIQKLKIAGIKAGVALLKATVPSTVAQYLQIADHALVFTGDLGHYGGVASMMQLEKVRIIKKMQPKIEIGWDGGANQDNVFNLVKGGVNIINCGSAVQKASDPAKAYSNLVNEAKRSGNI